MTRVLCRAETEPLPEGWRVTVSGLAPYEETRVYDRNEPDEAAAVFAAFDLFEREVAESGEG